MCGALGRTTADNTTTTITTTPPNAPQRPKMEEQTGWHEHAGKNAPRSFANIFSPLPTALQAHHRFRENATLTSIARTSNTIHEAEAARGD